MSEHSEQVALFQALKLTERQEPALTWAFAIPNGFYSTPAQKRKMRDEGLRRGVWDIFVPIPRNGKHGLFIEMKFGDNKLTPDQMAFGDYAKDAGYECRVAYDWEAAYGLICAYLGIEPYWE